MDLTVVPIVKPDAANFIFGQSHFIKTVEDLHEALVGAVPGICFGLAFCEASGKRLVRCSGNDEAAIALARNNALAIGAGHTFLIFLGDGFFPVNVLAAVRAVPEVCRIYCATANPTQVIVAQTSSAAACSAWWMAPRRWVSKPTPTLRGGKTCCEVWATSFSCWLKPGRLHHLQAGGLDSPSGHLRRFIQEDSRGRLPSGSRRICCNCSSQGGIHFSDVANVRKPWSIFCCRHCRAATLPPLSYPRISGLQRAWCLAFLFQAQDVGYYVVFLIRR